MLKRCLNLSDAISLGSVTVDSWTNLRKAGGA